MKGDPVKQSGERMLTTHVGSLPRSDDLLQMIQGKDEGRPQDARALADRVQSAVAELVIRQAKCGLDVVGDGEQSKTGFSSYFGDRLAGFEKGRGDRLRRSDLVDYPEYVKQHAGVGSMGDLRMAVTGPVSWKDFSQVEGDIANLKSALQQPGIEVQEAFLTAASPGVVARSKNEYYPGEEAYLFALADVMRREYEAIVQAGFVLQVDCPDLASDYNQHFPEFTVQQFRRRSALHVEALNRALADTAPDRVRIHVCWGNYEGPHHHDIALGDILDIVPQVRAAGLSIEASNPRHGHEWEVFEKVKLPPGKVLLPGVIDDKTNFIEHPELVCQRIVTYARLVGRENVIASVDCGFSSRAKGTLTCHPTIMWAKFQTLAEGARLATKKLWGQ